MHIDDSQGGRPEAKKHVRTPSKTEPEALTPLAPPSTPMYTVTPDYAAGLGAEFGSGIQVCFRDSILHLISLKCYIQEYKILEGLSLITYWINLLSSFEDAF